MRLIDADALKDYYGKWSNNHTEFLKPEIDHYIDAQPTVDAAPVVHGQWVHVPSSDMMTGKAYKCSKCGKMRYGSFMPNFCGNCGAKMDGERRTDVN